MIRLPYFLAILFLLPIHAICGPQELASAIHYTPPTNFIGGIAHPRTDPGDSPFLMDSPDFLEYGSRTGGEVFICYGLIGASIGKGKVINYPPVTTFLMKEEIGNECKKRFPNPDSILADEIGGLTSVKLTATQPEGRSRFYQVCWIQVETNIALKITAFASDAKTFQEITNSVQSITIDKDKFLNALAPKQANVITNQLVEVEVGHIQQNNDTLGVGVFHTKEKIYSFAVGHTFNPKNDLNESIAAFERLRDFSNDPNGLRLVLIDIAPGIPQTTLLYKAETNTEAIARFRMGNLRDSNLYLNLASLTLIWQFWDNQVPSGFQKEADYKMNATLYVRTVPPDE